MAGRVEQQKRTHAPERASREAHCHRRQRQHHPLDPWTRPGDQHLAHPAVQLDGVGRDDTDVPTGVVDYLVHQPPAVSAEEVPERLGDLLGRGGAPQHPRRHDGRAQGAQHEAALEPPLRP